MNAIEIDSGRVYDFVFERLMSITGKCTKFGLLPCFSISRKPSKSAVLSRPVGVGDFDRKGLDRGGGGGGARRPDRSRQESGSTTGAWSSGGEGESMLSGASFQQLTSVSPTDSTRSFSIDMEAVEEASKDERPVPKIHPKDRRLKRRDTRSHLMGTPHYEVCFKKTAFPFCHTRAPPEFQRESKAYHCIHPCWTDVVIVQCAIALRLRVHASLQLQE